MQLINRLLSLNTVLAATLAVLWSQPAASAADCATEVISEATATSYHARQVLDQNLCPVVADNPFLLTECEFVDWIAGTFGFIPNNGDPLPGIEVRFVYTAESFCDLTTTRSEVTLQISQTYLDAHSSGFVISSDQQIPSGDGITWIISQTGETAPPLSFEGTVTPSGAGYRVDVTFSTFSTEVTPSGAISDLIDFIGGAEAIDGGIENALLASLEAALASVEAGNFEAAEGQLNALINKVEAVRSKKLFDSVADQIIAAATEVLSLL
jgi:hypothetical protein